MRSRLFSLLASIVLLSGFDSSAKADETRLFQPVPYPKFEKGGLGNWWEEALTSGKAKLIQTRFVTPDYIAGILRESLGSFEADLRKNYFNRSKTELDEKLTQLATQFKTGLIRTDSRDYVVQYRDTANSMIRTIIDRVLEVHGVQDSKLRENWEARILSPFEDCIRNATHENQASACLQALTAGIGPNIGLATLRGNIELNMKIDEAAKSAAQLQESDAAYRACILAQGAVNDCVLRGVRTAMSHFAHAGVIRALREKDLSEKEAQDVWNKSAPFFSSCVSTKTSKKDFMECSDRMQVRIAGDSALEMMNDHPEVRKAFAKNEAARRALVDGEDRAYSDCAEKVRLSGKRDPQGHLDFEGCTTATYNHLTYAVVRKHFQEAVENRFGKSAEKKPARDRIMKAALSTMDRCWSERNEAPARNACLRKGVVSLSTEIANEKVDTQVREADRAFFASYGDFPKLKAEFSQGFRNCLENEKTGLPADVSDAASRGRGLDHCEFLLRRQIYSKVTSLLVFNRRADDLKLPGVKPEVLKAKTAYEQCLAGTPESAVYETQFQFCVSRYLSSVAKTIARETLNSKLKSAIGSAEFEKNKAEIDGIRYDFGNCVFAARMKNLNQLDGLVKDITACGDRANAEGGKFVEVWTQRRLNRQLNDDSISSKNAQKLFAEALPCLGQALGGDSGNAQAQADGVLADAVDIVGKYIEYDSSRAEKTLNQAFSEFFRDARAAGGNSTQARKSLFETLRKNGAFDQLVLSFIFNGIGETMNEKGIAAEIRKKLVTKENVNRIFGDPAGRGILDQAIDRIVAPAFLEGKSLTSPELLHEQLRIKGQVANHLVDSPTFGGILIRDNVQNQIDANMDQKNPFVRFFIKLALNDQAFQWDALQKTQKGAEAEAYIRENIMRPMVNGALSESDPKYREAADRARELIQDAVIFKGLHPSA